MPEVPGLVIQDSRRRRGQGIAECVVTQEGSCGTDILGGPELHELAEQARGADERLGRWLPPDVSLGQLGENLVIHIPSLPSGIMAGRRCRGSYFAAVVKYRVIR